MQSRDELDDSGDNDPYAVLERAADLVLKRSTEALERGEEDKISDAAVAMIMTAAVKLYANKADGEGRTFRPVLGRYDEVVTGTEALSAAIEILRALKLGPLEFALWARRRPEDESGDPA
ncbi:MAG TPA: hypothetical protein VJ846_07805 [Sphingomicrobium sp.]|nr:hypothetical protein [Sphingomicrobium sp.]